MKPNLPATGSGYASRSTPHGRAEISLTANREHKLPRDQHLTHLDRLEAESIHIIREVLAEAENPVMLYSVGKDSSVMLHLAREGVLPEPTALSALARRHTLEVSGNVRLPGPHGPAVQDGAS